MACLFCAFSSSFGNVAWGLAPVAEVAWAGDLGLPVARSVAHTVSGFVKDRESEENLIGAAVYAPYLRIGTTTNRL